MASSRNNTLEFSSAGSIILSGSSSYSGNAGNIGAIQFLKDSEIDEVGATNIYAADGTTLDTDDLADTFNAGTIIYGNFTFVTSLFDNL